MAYVDDLRSHEKDLRERLASCESDTAYAQLSRQWLNVRRELNEMDIPIDDDIESLLNGVQSVR